MPTPRRSPLARSGGLYAGQAALCLLSVAAGARAQGELDEDATSPPVLDHAPPVEALEGLGIAVEARLELIVGAAGAVEEAHLRSLAPALEPERAARVEAVAVAYAATLRFVPARVEGRAVAARVHYLVRFPAAPLADEALPQPEDAVEDEAADAAVEDEVEDDGGELAVEAHVETSVTEHEATAVSDAVVDLGELRRVPRGNAQNLLTLAPGLLLSQSQNEGHPASMFLRGFDAEEGEDLEITVEGVPLNEVSNAHGHGYADTLVVMPELVSSLRVVQGPFDPAQGDFAIAGSADYRLGLAERGLHGYVAYGSYHQRQLGVYWGPEGERPGTFAGVAYRGGDGWGQNRAFANATAMAQYEGRLDARVGFRLLGFAGTGSWDSPGLLRQDDLLLRNLPCGPSHDEQFYCTYDARQGGSSTRAGGSFKLEWLDGPGLGTLQAFGMGRSLRVRENFTGFTNDPRDDGGPQRGDLQDQRYDAATLGFRGAYRRHFEVFGERQRIEVGLYGRQDFADSVQERLRAELGVPYAIDFDRNFSITNLAAYLRADLRFTEWLSAMVGARVDAFNFRYVDRNFPDADRVGPRVPRAAVDAFGYLVQPRGAVRVRLVEGLSWITSAGLGARSSDAAALSEGELAPFAEVLAGESGLALDLGDRRAVERREGVRVTAGLSAFYTRVSQDLVFDAIAGRNTPTGPSHRSGATGVARLRFEEWLDTQLSVTYTRGHLPPRDASPFDLFAGPRLPYIPEWLVRFDGAITKRFAIEGEPVQGSVALGALFLSPRPLPLEQFSEPWFVLDAAASARWRWLELGLSAENLLDLRYRQAEYFYTSNFGDPARPPSMMPERHFSAGPPLRVMVRLTVHVQFGSPSWGDDVTEPRAGRAARDADARDADARDADARDADARDADARDADARDADARDADAREARTPVVAEAADHAPEDAPHDAGERDAGEPDARTTDEGTGGEP
ncbi:MAG: TonB-dependent receptor [Sandaracinaceae bacterium]|nr:TonB-dependent receptor [Sandaracinaceae bacterium]